jgi:hypothetical protein
MNKPTNEPSCKPICKPTNDQINDQTTNQTKQRLEQDELLPGNLSPKEVLFQVSMMDVRCKHAQLNRNILNHIK